MGPFHTIVVAVDFSETSADTLDAALELVDPPRHQLHLLHVVHDVRVAFSPIEAVGIDWDAEQAASNERARQQLVELAAICRLDPRHVTIAVEVGPAATGIVRYANEHAAEMIVLGSHGHGLVRRFMLGSVADHVLRQAACPVLLVPHRALVPAPSEVRAASGTA